MHLPALWSFILWSPVTPLNTPVRYPMMLGRWTARWSCLWKVPVFSITSSRTCQSWDYCDTNTSLVLQWTLTSSLRAPEVCAEAWHDQARHQQRLYQAGGQSDGKPRHQFQMVQGSDGDQLRSQIQNQLHWLSGNSWNSWLQSGGQWRLYLCGLKWGWKWSLQQHSYSQRLVCLNTTCLVLELKILWSFLAFFSRTCTVCWHVHCCLVEPPTFVRSLEPKDLVKGFEMTLECQVSGSAPFTVSFYKNTKVIRNDKRHRITVKDDLVALQLQAIEAGDVGLYQCTVENEVGSASCDCQVTLKGLCATVFFFNVNCSLNKDPQFRFFTWIRILSTLKVLVSDNPQWSCDT